MQYKTLLFDVDNTLLDFTKGENVALAKSFNHFQIELTNTLKERYLEINHALWHRHELGEITREEVTNTRFVKLFKEFNIDADGLEFEKFYQNELANQHEFIDGAEKILKYLMKDYDLYIVTNGVKTTQEKRLLESGLNKFFKDIFISEAIGYHKPQKEFFEYCFNKIPNFDPNKTLIIGDNLGSDIQGGINVNIDTCWFNRLNKDSNNMKITYIITSLNDLKNIL